ncbi:MAG: class I SAM-dependent methyltransferase [Halolamina sp.]
MREFTPEYLEHTRRGMWESTAALAPLNLDSRERVLDVGCGTGELSRVLAAETPGEVIGVDAATDLLAVAREDTGLPTVAGDATRLPFKDAVADLVVCQALLINLPDPAAAVREFARVSSDLVAAIEPNNAGVEVGSTVDAEERLEREVREAYLDGVETDVAMGERVGDLFDAAGVDVVARRTYRHEKLAEPPYSEAAIESAARKASGAGIAEHERELRAAGADYDALRAAWREMGRDVVGQMGEERYRRREVVPFEVTVGRV